MTEPGKPAGRTVGGRYELGERLGRGGMAEVYRAFDIRLGRPVALKQLRADLASDPTFQARFRREAQAAAGLNHPNIVAVYDTGEESEPASGAQIPYIVMELVEGYTLRDVLQDKRKILPERALELTAGILDALTFSHRAGIVHRDIKPANVMLMPSGDIKVMDFGIARAVADTSATMTQTAAVIGTAQYLSPEQARGETVDARSDLYSAGCVLYELLVGRPPFTGDSPVSVAYQHVREIPPPPSRLDSTIDPQIDAMAVKALAKDPADRYQSARAMKADITRVLAGEEATAAITPAHELAGSGEPDRNATQVRPAGRTTAPAAASHADPGAGGSGAAAATAPPEGSQRRKNRTGLVVVILILIALLLGGGTAAAWWYFHDSTSTSTPAKSTSTKSTSTRVTVPKVTGMDRARASSELKSHGLVGKFTEENGPDDKTVNTTTKQKPAADARTDKGSTVKVRVNIGPKRGTIPQGLVGMSYARAKSSLTDAGFDANNIARTDASQPEPTDSRKNEVLTADPKEGTDAGLNSKVTLTVATGKSKVPDLTGELQKAAKRDAKKAGFKTHAKRVKPDGEPAGTVMHQSIDPGTLMQRGKTITIKVAKKTSPTPGPTVTKTKTKKPSASASDSDDSDSDDGKSHKSDKSHKSHDDDSHSDESDSPTASASQSESPSASSTPTDESSDDSDS